MTPKSPDAHIACWRAFTFASASDSLAGFHGITFMVMGSLRFLSSAFCLLSSTFCLLPCAFSLSVFRLPSSVFRLWPASPRRERGANPRQMVIAVPNGVVLQHELAGERGVGIERDRRRSVQLIVGQLANRRRGRRAVAAEQIQRRLFRHRVVLARVMGVDVAD